MKKYIYLFFGAALLALTGVSACKKETTGDKKYLGPEFNLDKFDQNLRESILPSGAIGWAYVITQNGLFVKGGGFGKSRNNADGNQTFTINRKINLASVSKWLTAMAVMQLLEEKGLDHNDPINPYLPPSWNRGPGVTTITFGQLLGHTSGLSSYNTAFSRTLTYSGLRRMIDTGVIRPKTYDYLNANFALCRILIPSLWKGMPGAPPIVLLDSATTEAAYIQYMQEKVFEPVGLTGVDCEDQSRLNATLYYATSDLDANSGLYYGSWTSWAGGGGFYMTTMELARVLAYYRHTEVIISKESRKVMEDNRYGFEGKDDAREIHGTYLPKGGSIINGGQGVVTQIVCFPNNVEVAVVFNSQGMTFAGGETSIRRALYDAFNKSWD